MFALSVGFVLVLRPCEEGLRETPIGPVVTRSPLVEERSKNGVPSNLLLRYDDSRPRDGGPCGIEIARFQEHMPVVARDLALTPPDNALKHEETLRRYLSKAGTVCVEPPVHKVLLLHGGRILVHATLAVYVLWRLVQRGCE